MCHIAHVRNQFKSINTFAQSYEIFYNISQGKKNPNVFFGRIKCSLFVKSWFPFTPSILQIWIPTTQKICQFLLKLAQWFWRRRRKYKKSTATTKTTTTDNEQIVIRIAHFIYSNLNTLHQRMLYAKFRWNWPSGSGEEGFFNFVNVFSRFRKCPHEEGFLFAYQQASPTNKETS